MRKQKGFTIFEAIVVVVGVIIVASVGYMFLTNMNKQSGETASTVSSPSTSPEPELKKAADLDSVSEDLDAVSLDDSEISEFDSATNSF